MANKIDIRINAEDFKKKLNVKDGYTPVKGVDYFDGNDGYTPIKGKDYFDGKDYILTPEDRQVIAKSIDVPVVEKVIERTEVIKEQPIYNTEIKEVSKDITQEDITNIAIQINPIIEYSKIKGIPNFASGGLNRITKDEVQKMIDEIPEPSSKFTDLDDTFASYTGLAGKGLRVNATETGIDTYTPTDTDEKVKYDASDPTAGYVADKFVAGTGITLSEGTGADENKLVITNNGVITETDPTMHKFTDGLGADIINNGVAGGNSQPQNIQLKTVTGGGGLSSIDILASVITGNMGKAEVNIQAGSVSESGKVNIRGSGFMGTGEVNLYGGVKIYDNNGDTIFLDITSPNRIFYDASGFEKMRFSSSASAIEFADLVGGGGLVYANTLGQLSLNAESWFNAAQNTVNLSGFNNDMGFLAGVDPLVLDATTRIAKIQGDTTYSGTLQISNASDSVSASLSFDGGSWNHDYSWRPTQDLTYNLGDSSYRYNNGYINNLYGSYAEINGTPSLAYGQQFNVKGMSIFEGFFLVVDPVLTDAFAFYFIDPDFDGYGYLEMGNYRQSDGYRAPIYINDAGGGVLIGGTTADNIVTTDSAGFISSTPLSSLGFLLLDQTTPQTVTGGIPIFQGGIAIDDGTQYIYSSGGTDMDFYVGDGIKQTITQTGNVLIGTTSDDTVHKLQVYSRYFRFGEAADDFRMENGNVIVGAVADSGDNFQVAGTSFFNDKIQLEDTSTYFENNSGDIDVYTTTEKTLELQTSVWEDIQFAISSGKVGNANVPTWEAFTANTSAYSFDIDDYIDLGANEMFHIWKEGTTVHPHLHVTTNGANTSGSSQYVKFTLYIGYADVNEVWTETPLDFEKEIIDGTADMTHLLINGQTLALPDNRIGTQIKIRIKRIAATTGTEYPTDIFVTQVGFHAEVDTMGSRTISSK